MASLTRSMDTGLSKLPELMTDRKPGVLQLDMTEQLNNKKEGVRREGCGEGNTH